jgi:two-component system alkaline phosphatase synthesis response regulator PhoP
MRAQLLILSEEGRGQKLRVSLEKAGFYAAVRETILAGLDFVRDAYPDLVILGSPLRDGSVVEACRRLRHSRSYAPIIVYVEQADDFDRILALEIGADDYVAETANLRELVARIRAQLRRAYEFSLPETDVIRVGDLVIDCTRGQAFRNRRSLDLTPIEFRLLVLLIRHSGQVLSRAQILGQVWGYEVQPYDEQVVNVHICRLRRKVEPDLSQPALIQTVPGFGYRLDAALVSG